MHLSNIQVRSARAHLGLEQKDIHKVTGISKNQLSKFERGMASLSSKNLQKLFDFFTVQQIEFLDHDGIKRKPSINHITLHGDEGLRTLFDDIYETTKETGDEIVIYNGVPKKLLEHLGKEFYQMHADRMSKLKNSVRALIRHGDTNFIGAGWAQYKWLPEGKFKEKTDYVYGGKTAFISFNDEVKILLIEQKDIADSQRDKFNDVWDNSAEETPIDVY
ncbi:MAG: helix-turn-helix transcriptional regulator [Cyclobacteriaceae bacterium]